METTEHPSHSPTELDAPSRDVAETPADGDDATLLPHEQTKSLGCLSAYHSQWLAFWILGTINNFSYVVVNSAAKSIADSFNKSDLIGVVQWANVGFGIVFKSLNTWFLIDSSYQKRMIANTLMMTVGLVMAAFSIYIDFSFAIIGIVLIGSASAFGESVLLGYLKAYNPSLTGAWSSGTGMAGVGGTMLYLALFSLGGMSNRDVFLLNLPLAAIYYAAFVFVTKSLSGSELPDQVADAGRRLSTDSQGVAEYSALKEDQNQLVHPAASKTRKRTRLSPTHQADEGDLYSPVPSPKAEDQAHNQEESEQEHDLEHAQKPKEATIARSIRVFKHVANRSLQLAAVYFFEYVVSVGFAQLANPRDRDPVTHALLPWGSWWQQHAYEVLAFCYQVGVLISRSSISLLKIRKIWILTTLQGANFILWLFHARDPFLPLWAQFVLMVYVGLLGGAMYVNVFFLLLEDPELNQADKELGINMTSIFVNIGIVTSSLFEILMDKTFLAAQVEASSN